MFEVKHSIIVIAVNGHSPMILSEEFLKKLEIVPNEWVTEQVIVTPPLSQVLFTNGYTVKMETNRFTIEVGDPKAVNFDFGATSALKLINTLAYFRYRATGINFIAEAKGENLLPELRAKLLREPVPDGLQGLRLDKMLWAGKLTDVELGLTFEVSGEGENELLKISSNYHRVTESVESASEALGKFDGDLADFGYRLGGVLG